LQPAKVRVKAKSVTLDNKTIFFPILSSPPFPLFRSLKPVARPSDPYLVFASSFFSGAGAASFIGSLGAGGAGSGAAGAGAGGGGGGAGSSFLPHPNVSVNAKRVIADNKPSFFPILIHLLSVTLLKNFLSVKNFVSHKSEGVSSANASKFHFRAQRFCSMRMNRSAAFVPARGKSSIQLTLQPATGPCSRNLYGQWKKFRRNFLTKCRHKTNA
jgi:hypothetical protein